MNIIRVGISVLIIIVVNANHSNMVLFSPNKEIKSFYVPVSKHPIISWIDVQEGIYPNVTPITEEVKIGTPLSIMIYYNDRSRLYDMVVNDCLAYDQEKFTESKRVFTIYNDSDTIDNAYGKLNYWKQVKNIEKFTTLLYSNFTAFKFPEKDNIFLTCNVEICYGNCKLNKDRLNEI